jgi:GNAT superfamily N-acetyltransferase
MSVCEEDSDKSKKIKENLKIRFLDPSEVVNYHRIIKEMLYFIKTKKRLKRIINDMVDHQKSYFVGMDLDDKPVGFAEFNISWQMWDEKICYVNHLVIDRDVRGYGLGTKMLQFIIEFAEEKGCGGIELRSDLHRKNAHTFYYKQGFSIDCFNFRKDINL